MGRRYGIGDKVRIRSDLHVQSMGELPSAWPIIRDMEPCFGLIGVVSMFPDKGVYGVKIPGQTSDWGWWESSLEPVGENWDFINSL